MAETLGEYETFRAQNIERNNARLRSLGLISAQEERDSNDVAWRKRKSKAPRADEKEKGAVAAGAKRRRCVLPDSDRFPSRKSSRLQGKGPEDDAGYIPLEGDLTYTSRMAEKRAARVKECREVRIRRALEVSQAGADKAATENPTASYEHCLMRVQSMTDKGLANRVRAIERAAGKHCVVKMAIFKSCLQDQGMWDLAGQAAAGLERLKAINPTLDTRLARR